MNRVLYSPYPSRLEVVEVDEPQRSGVDAVAQPAFGAGAVVEHVAEMAVAVRGAHLGADHQMAEVALLDDVGGLDRLGEARPAGTAVELVDRREQRLAGDHVDVDAGLVVVPVLAGERPLGAVLLGHVVLLRRQRVDGRGVLVVLVCHSASITVCACRIHRSAVPGLATRSTEALALIAVTVERCA